MQPVIDPELENIGGTNMQNINVYVKKIYIIKFFKSLEEIKLWTNYNLVQLLSSNSSFFSLSIASKICSLLFIQINIELEVF